MIGFVANLFFSYSLMYSLAEPNWPIIKPYALAKVFTKSGEIKF
jgi:hypothetical protein